MDGEGLRPPIEDFIHIIPTSISFSFEENSLFDDDRKGATLGLRITDADGFTFIVALSYGAVRYLSRMFRFHDDLMWAWRFTDETDFEAFAAEIKELHAERRRADDEEML